MNTSQSLIDLKKISCSESLLSSFVEEYPNSCSIKDRHSKKIILTNSKEAKYLGVKSVKDIIGVTQYEIFVLDVFNRRRNLNLDSVIIANEHNNLKQVDALEEQLLLDEHHIETNLININFNGLIAFEKIVKFPVLSHDSKRIIACLSFFRDMTDKLSLNTVLQLYRQYYTNTKSIHKVIKHFNLDEYFSSTDFPTFREMQVLFAMRDDDRHKVIAKKLECSVSTVSNHITNIQNKLSNQFSVYDILYKLRTKHKSVEHVFISA